METKIKEAILVMEEGLELARDKKTESAYKLAILALEKYSDSLVGRHFNKVVV